MKTQSMQGVSLIPFSSYRFPHSCSRYFQLIITDSPTSVWPESYDHDSFKLTLGPSSFISTASRLDALLSKKQH
uniref:Uncharacterized protein n=1 Tax=Populus trichocarpa TaxID=3694 RepID=A0A2K1Z6G2_POPTR